MKCTTCGAWTSVLETREAAHGTTRRTRLCANGHRFPSVEISLATYTRAQPSILLSMRTISARIIKWRRDLKILQDPRPAAELSEAMRMGRPHINTIRRVMRADLARAQKQRPENIAP